MNRPLFSTDRDDTSRGAIHCSPVGPPLGARGRWRRIRHDVELIAIAIGLVVMFLAVAVGLARGQGSHLLRPATDQDALAHVCANEIGLSGAPEECAAIADVLRDRAERNGWTFAEAALRYSTLSFDGDRRDGRAWVAHLRADGARPDVWPDPPHVPWNARLRARWLRLRDAAGAVLRADVLSDCDEPPMHWGMRHGIDHERAQRFGWIEVACFVPCAPEGSGPSTGADGAERCATRNAFYLVPSRLRERD